MPEEERVVMPASSFRDIIGTDEPKRVRIKRSPLLKEQVGDVLRDCIIAGRLAPGTKLVERELAEYLGVSRIPVRDALLELEKEGLVITRPNGRYLIELSDRDIRELYQVRLALEKLAARFAAQNISAADQEELRRKLGSMRAAVTEKDKDAYIRYDVEIHHMIWRLAGNRHLLKTLDSMVGPIFMFVAWHAERFSWQETLDLHENLVAAICSGDGNAAEQSIECHLQNALQRSLASLASTRRA
jgi:DNA-binding GntR family transcriptional regulator